MQPPSAGPAGHLPAASSRIGRRWNNDGAGIPRAGNRGFTVSLRLREAGKTGSLPVFDTTYVIWGITLSDDPIHHREEITHLPHPSAKTGRLPVSGAAGSALLACCALAVVLGSAKRSGGGIAPAAETHDSASGKHLEGRSNVGWAQLAQRVQAHQFRGPVGGDRVDGGYSRQGDAGAACPWLCQRPSWGSCTVDAPCSQ